MDNIPPWAQSSVDSTKLSLSIESFGKVLIGFVGLFAAAKGLDVQATTDQAQLFIDQGVMVAASAFTLYQSLMTVYGLARKLFVHAVVPQSIPDTTPVVPIVPAPMQDASVAPAATIPLQWEEQSVG